MVNDILRNNYSAIPDRLRINYVPYLAIPLALSAFFAVSTPSVYRYIDSSDRENCQRATNANDVASCIARIEDETKRKIDCAENIFIPATLLSAAIMAAYSLSRRK